MLAIGTPKTVHHRLGMVRTTHAFSRTHNKSPSNETDAGFSVSVSLAMKHKRQALHALRSHTRLCGCASVGAS
eukprot:228184-Chlamydomonas_euryale.AAC.1